MCQCRCLSNCVRSVHARNRYTFGYGRYEVLSGFTNGILLVFVSLMVLGEGIGRLFGNPEIDAEHLTIVAVAGFCVNLIGDSLGEGGGGGSDSLGGGGGGGGGVGGGGGGGSGINLASVCLW